MSTRKTLALIVATMTLATGCFDHSAANDKRKVLHLVLEDDVKWGDPGQADDVISAEFVGQIFEGLMSFSYLGRIDQTEPLLAEGDPVIRDKGTTVVFRVRHGIYFQNDAAFPGGKGREVTPDDFIYSFKRIADPRIVSQNWWSFDGVIEGLNAWRDAIAKAPPEQKEAEFRKPVVGLSSPKPNLLVFKLIHPYPQLRYILSMTHTGVMAHEVVEKYGPEITSHPVGTGPFQLKDWVHGSKIILLRNPHYRSEFYPSTGTDEARQQGLLRAAAQKIPFVDEIQYDIIKEEQPSWLKFRKGQVDVAKIPKDNFLEVIDADGQLKGEFKNQGMGLHKELSLTAWWIEFNLKDPLLGKNLKLRQALATAFDRTRALDLLFNNRGMLIDSPIPPSLDGASGLPNYPYEYNLAKAKELLREAGFPEGKGLPELVFDLRNPNTTSRQLGELLRDNFAKIGVNLNILANSYPEALQKQKTSRFQIMLGGWAGDYPDAENFLQNFITENQAPGTNTSNFSDKEFDHLYQQIRLRGPSKDRRAAIHRMVEILQREAPIACFYVATEYRLTWNWIKNYRFHLLYYGKDKFLDLNNEARTAAQ